MVLHKLNTRFVILIMGATLDVAYSRKKNKAIILLCCLTYSYWIGQKSKLYLQNKHLFLLSLI